MRLDQLLTQRGLAISRSKAAEWIREGAVRVNGAVVVKASAEVDPAAEVEIAKSASRYVGRGALKLIDALDGWCLDVAGKDCVDLGASTGGFTQVLLERGARAVLAVDVGTDQLDPRLREDPRVLSMEKTNVRHLTRDVVNAAFPTFPLPFRWVCCDLSFISLTLIFPVLADLTGDGATLLALIKPQFEVGPRYVGKGGIVKDEKARRKALDVVTASAQRAGFLLQSVKPSSIRGGDGNIEYLALFERVEVAKTNEIV